MTVTRIESTGGYVAEGAAFGPTEGELEAARREMEATVLRERLRGRKHRWLKFGTAPRSWSKRGDDDTAGFRFEGLVYDYVRHEAIEVSGAVDALDQAKLRLSSEPPHTRLTEFLEAVEIVQEKHELGPALATGQLRAYPPMPPFVLEPLGDGRSRRLITVGLFAVDNAVTGSTLSDVLGGALHQILSVDLATQEIDTVGPQTAEAGSECGAPLSDETCPPTGLTGQMDLTVTAPDGTEIWRLLVVRPAESVGTNGSGVELREVHYRGRKLLFQAHVPILNVEYQGATPSCGPTFRDWLDQEACFQANGTDVGPGFRFCDERPQTLIDSGSDSGNFRGVAVYFDGNDLLLVSELQAGWYRYMTEWRLLSDGTIQPRVGFSAVSNFCTCQFHIHHAYYRFDWDIEQFEPNRVEEFNVPPELPLNEEWTTLLFETSRFRDESRGRHWRISNVGTGRHYLLNPGASDGEADLYGGGDAWFLRYKASEIDDGQGFTSDPLLSRERIDLFADGELLDGQDIISWYALHWSHDHKVHPEIGAFLGPELTCSWAEEIPDPTTTTTSTTTTTTTAPTTTTTATAPTTTTTTTAPDCGPGGGGGSGRGSGGGSGGGGGGRV